jgi:electron transfer flavoprotein beta subunit
MRFLVCMKQSVDTSKMEVDKETGRLKRTNVNNIINPTDLIGLDAALALKDQVGGTVTVVTMGPPQAESVLREAAARGADEFCLVSDRAFGGADTLATSYTLSKVISHLEDIGDPFDIIFCGQESVDGGTAQVGPEIASMLGLPDIAAVVSLHAGKEGWMQVGRAAERGIDDLAVRVPCLLTCTTQLNQPRYPSIKGILQKDNIVIHTITASALDFDPNRIGVKGSPTTVKQVRALPSEVKNSVKMDGNTDEALAEELADMLQNMKVI